MWPANVVRFSLGLLMQGDIALFDKYTSDSGAHARFPLPHGFYRTIRINTCSLIPKIGYVERAAWMTRKSFAIGSRRQ